MIQVTPQMRVLVAIEPVDFRAGIDGIARMCRERLTADPFSGTAYVFRNRRGMAIKVLVYDGQ
jgi:transposase